MKKNLGKIRIAAQLTAPDTLFAPLVTDSKGKFGLGLAIVQKVVKGHDWKIRAYNLEKGVCFELELKD